GRLVLPILDRECLALEPVRGLLVAQVAERLDRPHPVPSLRLGLRRVIFRGLGDSQSQQEQRTIHRYGLPEPSAIIPPGLTKQRQPTPPPRYQLATATGRQAPEASRPGQVQRPARPRAGRVCALWASKPSAQLLIDTITPPELPVLPC